jgi:hypothetical protein
MVRVIPFAQTTHINLFPLKRTEKGYHSIPATSTKMRKRLTKYPRHTKGSVSVAWKRLSR